MTNDQINILCDDETMTQIVSADGMLLNDDSCVCLVRNSNSYYRLQFVLDRFCPLEYIRVMSRQLDREIS